MDEKQRFGLDRFKDAQNAGCEAILRELANFGEKWSRRPLSDIVLEGSYKACIPPTRKDVLGLLHGKTFYLYDGEHSRSCGEIIPVPLTGHAFISKETYEELLASTTDHAWFMFLCEQKHPLRAQ